MSNKSLARKNRNRYDRRKHYILKINLFKPNGNDRIYHPDILRESSGDKKGKIRNVSLSGAYGEFPHPLPGGIPVESMNILSQHSRSSQSIGRAKIEDHIRNGVAKKMKDSHYEEAFGNQQGYEVDWEEFVNHTPYTTHPVKLVPNFGQDGELLSYDVIKD